MQGHRLVVAVDLDGVLCVEDNSLGYHYEGWLARAPIPENIRKINRLYEAGHYIIIYTARHPEDELPTRQWLKKHGVKYHRLVLGKIHFDVYVDEAKKLFAIEDL